MNFIKKLFGIKPKGKDIGNSKKIGKQNSIEDILKSNDKPEILYKSRVRLAVGGDKETSANNAFLSMGIPANGKLKTLIMEHYVWQSFGDLDADFNCTMLLVRIDIQEKYKPEIDGETAINRLFSNL